MEVKLFDSELKVMEVIWKEGDITAKEIAEAMKKKVGWSKTTTYTVIKKCIDKGVIKRQEPKFICHALITKKQVQQYETDELINKMYNGSVDKLVASILGNKNLTSQEIKHLKQIVNDLK